MKRISLRAVSLIPFAIPMLVAINACTGGGNGQQNAAPQGNNPDGEDPNAPGKNDADGGGKPIDSTDPFAACKGVEFQTAGTFDIDMKAVRVRGKVTVDGALPTVTTGDAPGRITFTLKANGARGAATTTITAEDGQYETTLAPGTYDIGYAPNTQACATTTSTSSWPCNGHVVKAGVAITKDGVVDLDLPTIVVRGNVKLKGQAWPATSTLPAITFSEVVTGTGTTATTAAVSVVSPSGYSTRLFKGGTYDVGYSPRSSGCGSTVPCNAGIVKPGVNLGATGTLDVDVPMVVARGLVSLDGTPMSGATRGGSITFASTAAAAAAGGKPPTPASITIATDGRYAIGLLPDTYNILYSGVPSSSSTSPLPRGPGLLKSAQAIKTDGTLDLDVPTVRVTGKVSVNGTQLNSTLESTLGTLTFNAKDVGVASTSILADGTYSTVVVAGASYDVGFAPSGTCEPTEATPCNSGVLKSALTLQKGAGALDLDMKVVALTGNVALNGSKISNAMAASSFSPEITFAIPTPANAASEEEGGGGLAKKGVYATDISETGTYSTRLLAGNYDIGYGAAASCAGMTPDEMELPCVSGTIRPNVALTSNGALDIDVLSAVVQGRVTLGGQAVPTSPMDRGALAFIGKTSGQTTTDTFGTDGPITYKAHLLRGRYIILYNPNTQCSGGLESTPLPCMGTVLAGCE